MKSTNKIYRESILKQMLWESAEHYLVEEYSCGRIYKGKLAEMLDMNIYEVNDLLDRYHILASIILKHSKYKLCREHRCYHFKKHIL